MTKLATVRHRPRAAHPIEIGQHWPKTRRDPEIAVRVKARDVRGYSRAESAQLEVRLVETVNNAPRQMVASVLLSDTAAGMLAAELLGVNYDLLLEAIEELSHED